MNINELNSMINIVQSQLRIRVKFIEYGYILKENYTLRIGWNRRPLNNYTTLMRIRRK